MIARSEGSLVLLSTYPFAAARHGGQLRAANLERGYKAAGWSVKTLAIYQPEAYGTPQLGPHDIPFPMESPYRKFAGQSIPCIEDLQSGAFAAAEDGGFDQVLNNLPSNIDVLHIEQPWLWPLAMKLKQRPEFASSFVVYSSQNIETPLKARILEAFDDSAIARVIDAVDALEKRAAREADLTIAVSKEDAVILREWGAHRVIVASNGISPWRATEGDLARWKKRLPTSPWLLYIASGHPPNYTHFMDIFGGSLACFPPVSRLVVVGGVCDQLYHAAVTSKWNSLNLSRLQLLHQLEDDDLAAVKTLAHGFVLPIPFGGGTNIKTAEALFSSKHVIGTQAAFRGYEEYLDLPGIRVTATAKDMQAAVREVVQTPARAVGSDPTEHERRQALRWDKSLEPAIQAVGELAGKGNSRG